MSRNALASGWSLEIVFKPDASAFRLIEVRDKLRPLTISSNPLKGNQ